MNGKEHIAYKFADARQWAYEVNRGFVSEFKVGARKQIISKYKLTAEVRYTI